MGNQELKFTEPKIIIKGISFGEAPLWHKDGFLIFCDVEKNRIMKFENGILDVFLEESGWKGAPTPYQSDQPGSNGMAYDQNGDIVFCQHGSHAISRLTNNKTIETIVDSYNERRLNSPNDLCIGKNNGIYFSDPPYGINGKKLNPQIAQAHAGVYRWANNNLELLSTEFKYPNGICFSPDYKHLYIGSNFPEDKYLRRYEVINGRIYHGINFTEENADGIKTDKGGNLYLATLEGIKIFSRYGEQIGFIKTHEMTTNICIHENQLFITTPSTVLECFMIE